jgi:hypothetical protein
MTSQLKGAVRFRFEAKLSEKLKRNSKRLRGVCFALKLNSRFHMRNEYEKKGN